MAYRRRSRYSGARRAPARRGYRTYGRRTTSRRRRSSRRTGSRAQRIVIQVVGGGAAVPASPVNMGMKSARVVRSRY